MQRSTVRFCVLFLFLFVGATLAFAQFSGSITGLVQDPSGAAVPGAALTLTNDGTGEQRDAVADAAGVYSFVSLAPGNYHLTTKAPGFSNSATPLVLQTSQVLNIPVKLAIGTSAETVQVTTLAPVLDTADTRIQETLSTGTLASLPLAGRSMISLVTLAPGVPVPALRPMVVRVRGGITTQPRPRWMPAPMDRALSATCTSSMVSM